jgi:ribosomal protein S18 acetylase RimI-like enzyme
MTTPAAWIVRRATNADLPALGRLGALLMRTHYAFDSLRFLAPGGNPEEGYAWFLGDQLTKDDVVVFVAEKPGEEEIAGYVYAGIEPLSWKELRDVAGFIHDVAVDPHARRHGVAASLIEAAIGWLSDRGVPRVMLWTADRNQAAQQLFTRLGFRRTMIEMTREL